MIRSPKMKYFWYDVYELILFIFMPCGDISCCYLSLWKPLSCLFYINICLDLSTCFTNSICYHSFLYVRSTLLPPFLSFFWSCDTAFGILVSWPGSELQTTAVKALCPNYWTARELLHLLFRRSFSENLLIVNYVSFYCTETFFISPFYLTPKQWFLWIHDYK